MLTRISCERCKVGPIWTDEAEQMLAELCPYRDCEGDLRTEDEREDVAA